MKHLRQALAEASAEQLRQIYRLWGMSTESTEPNERLRTHVETLLKHVKDPIATRFAWEHLTDDERLVLYRLIVPAARDGTSQAAILKKTEFTEQHLTEVVASLKHYVLCYDAPQKKQTAQLTVVHPSGSKSKSKSKAAEEQVTMLYPFAESTNALYATGRELFSTVAKRAEMTLEQIVMTLPQGELALIVQRYGLSWDQYVYRNELREAVLQELKHPEGILAIVQKLSPEVQNLVKWLCTTKEGKASMQEVRKHTGYDDSTLSAALHNLEDIAVAFDALTEQGRVLFVPNDVAAIFKKALEHPEAVAVQPGLRKLTSPPLTVHTSDTLVLYDLAVIIGSAYQQDLEPTQAGRVPKRLAAKIQPLLHGKPRRQYIDSDDDYMEMLFDIALGLGLLQLSQPVLQEVKPRYEPGIHLAKWAKQGRLEQTKQLLKHWQEKPGWIDLLGSNYVEWDSYLWRPMQARSLIMNYLRKCTPGQWYSVASLLETIWDEDPLALRPQQYGYYHGFGTVGGSGKPKKPGGNTVRAKWMNAEGALYTGLLASVLYELGIVSIGYQVPSAVVDAGQVFNPDAFMVTELGAGLLAEKTSSTSSTFEHTTTERLLVVQPSFEVLLLHPEMAILHSLLPFVQINQVEVVSRFTLTRASVLRGLRNGLTVDQMLQVLQEHSQREIAQNVEYTLRDWARLYKGARLSQAVLLEVSDEALANEICASPKLQPFGLRRLGPCAIAARGDVNSLRRTLDKEGIAVNIT